MHLRAWRFRSETLPEKLVSALAELFELRKLIIWCASSFQYVQIVAEKLIEKSSLTADEVARIECLLSSNHRI